ncbi:MAG: DUF5057 domain-containing protein [Clostridium sp.]|nr:DUF5057 domain-containing protein [Clostridium sp.]
MKRKTKIMISALSAMLLMVLAATIVSFSLAGNSDEAEVSDEQILYAAGDTSLTIIDRIILNSIDGEDKEYKIVEIGSTASPSYTKLEDGIDVSYMGALANGSVSDFKQYVIDSHKSDADEIIDKVMEADTIKYKYYYVSDITDDDLEDISSADLIYVSNDPNDPYKAGSKDFSEELYSAILHTYTSNKKKPLIIDSPIDTEKIAGTQSNTVPMSKLAQDVFAPKGSRYYTFAWDTTIGVDAFYKHQSGSLYLGINGSRKTGNWTNLVNDATSDRNNIAKMLVISPKPTRTSDELDDNLKPITADYYPMAYALLGLDDNDITISGTDDDGNRLHFYGITQKLLYSNGYNAKYDRPKGMFVDTYRLQDGDTELVNIDFDQYDMIVIEDGLEHTQITPELYRKFSAAMIGNVSIVYNSKMGTASDSGSTGGYDPTASNYNKLFSMIASSSGESLMSNVMVTNRDDFGGIALSKSAATCKTIADLINKSAFRTFGGANSSGNTFTVLEIQPCYPIDRELAAELGKNDATKRSSVRDMTKISARYGYDNYYTVPANVVNNATKEQVPAGQEYYAWEVSDAKIIDAIGTYANIDASNINIVHMSSEELAASTTAILGTYDLIYIGGNISAKKTADEYQGVDGVVGWTLAKQNFSDITKLPIYTTYSHNGEMTAVNLATTGESGGPVRGGTTFAAEVTPYADKSPWGSNVFAVLNGNDITYNKAQELLAYIKSGMPVIVSDDAAVAYEALRDAKTNAGSEYLQNSLDPDSNMRDVLEACYNVQAEKGNAGSVLWKFDKDATYTTDNDGGRLGSTLVGYVRVYASSAGDTSIEGTDDGNPAADADGKVVGQKENIVTLYNNSVHRPKIEATKLPKLYDDTQKDSSLKKNANGEYVLDFEYEVSGTFGDYTVMFYIDDDGNGRYTTGSGDIYQKFEANSGSYTLPDSYFGAFAWKLEVTDNKTKAMASITGVSKIDMPADEKKTVRVLQIMPGEGDSPVGEGSQGCNSLYFCTTCQQACMRLEYNPVANTGSLFSLYYQGSHVFNDSRKNNVITDGASVGKHEHTFGIVKYDSTIDDAWISDVSNWAGQPGADDWHYNLADEISDMYDFQLDILTRGEVEAISDEVRAAYNVSETERDAKIADFDAKIAGSTDFDDYKALTDPDEKIVYIIQYEAEVSASDYWSSYIAMRDETADNAVNTYTDPITNTSVNSMTTFDAKAELDGAIDELIKNLSVSGTTIGGMSGPEIAEVLQQIKDEEKYFNYFNIVHGGQNVGMYHNDEVAAFLTSAERSGKKYTTYLKDYVTAKDLELSYLEMYKKYDRIAHADNWMKGCYDTVILGPSEDFAGDDFTKDSNGLRDLVNYTKDGGNLLMFHDTFTRFSSAGSANLTDALRPYVGMDKNHQEADTSKMSAQTYYLPYKTIDGYDENKYYIMNLNYKDTPVAERDTAWYETWSSEMGTAANMASPTKYLTSVAYTDSVLAADKSFNLFASPYRFAELSWSYAAHWANQSDSDARTDMQKGYGTDRATRNNQGLVTLYPFSLSEKIYVSGTHAQSYALDLEDDSTTVWYSLAGGYNKQEGSSMYAASPNDGMDNYFIYSYKNVYYCGAGHSKVTGIGKNNNDERKLYINIICNSVKPSASQPSIHIYDYEKDTYGDKIKQQGGSYYTTVDTTDDYAEFSFKVITDQEAGLKTVKIFFDLDYSDTNRLNAYSADQYHVLIGQWNAPDVKAGTRFDVGRYINGLLPLTNADLSAVMDIVGTDADGNAITRQATRLRLRPEYFDPYNGEYTYLVIEAEDTNGNKVYQRIKIRLKEYLFNLT